MHHQLTTFKKKESESVTAVIIRTEPAATTLKAANENVRDALLVPVVLKGLLEELKPFIAIATQSEEHQIFQKFKKALQNFEETEKTRNVTDGGNGKSDNKITKAKSRNFDESAKKFIECYACGKKGHKSTECFSDCKRCSNCKSSTHIDKTCWKSKDKAKKTYDFT